jgi:hypothetical protein
MGVLSLLEDGGIFCDSVKDILVSFFSVCKKHLLKFIFVCYQKLNYASIK